MRRKFLVRLDPDIDIFLQKVSEETGESQAKALNRIMREYASGKKEIINLHAAVAAARAAEDQGRLIQEILNSMLLGWVSLSDRKYEPNQIHPIVDGARKADMLMRYERMMGKIE